MELVLKKYRKTTISTQGMRGIIDSRRYGSACGWHCPLKQGDGCLAGWALTMVGDLVGSPGPSCPIHYITKHRLRYNNQIAVHWREDGETHLLSVDDFVYRKPQKLPAGAGVLPNSWWYGELAQLPPSFVME